MTEKEAQLLLQKYRLGLCSQQEMDAIEKWYGFLLSQNETEKLSNTEKQQLYEKLSAHITKETEENTRRRRPLLRSRKVRRGIAVAMMLVTVILVSAIFLFRDRKFTTTKESPLVERYRNEIQPGKYGASWTVNAISQTPIHIDEHSYNTKVGNLYDVKVLGQKIIFTCTPNVDTMVYNTVTTAKGEQYMVQLTDGTNVWLNADSKITFTIPFAKDKREIKVEGEAYLEVAKDPTKPFMVQLRNSSVRVLGTHFDVNSYMDEPFETATLLEGRIAFQYANTSNGVDSVIMAPGQQVIFRNRKATMNNLSSYKDVIAWKDGYFAFENTDLATVMRQLARWYNIEVKYSDHFTNEQFFGFLHRDAPLSEILKVLEKSGARFSIDKNIVTVL